MRVHSIGFGQSCAHVCSHIMLIILPISPAGPFAWVAARVVDLVRGIGAVTLCGGGDLRGLGAADDDASANIISSRPEMRFILALQMMPGIFAIKNRK